MEILGENIFWFCNDSCREHVVRTVFFIDVFWVIFQMTVVLNAFWGYLHTNINYVNSTHARTHTHPQINTENFIESSLVHTAKHWTVIIFANWSDRCRGKWNYATYSTHKQKIKTTDRDIFAYYSYVIHISGLIASQLKFNFLLLVWMGLIYILRVYAVNVERTNSHTHTHSRIDNNS